MLFDPCCPGNSKDFTHEYMQIHTIKEKSNSVSIFKINSKMAVIQCCKH